MTETADRRIDHPPTSRFLHRLGEASASTAAPILAAIISLAFLAAALWAPRASPWLTAFEALSAAITLIMVFALQHAQTRQQIAVQRRLDEILRVLPHTDSRLIHAETARPGELEAHDERHRQARLEALRKPPSTRNGQTFG